MDTEPTVLVVDDERPLVRLVRSYLERERFRVIEAFDGRTALDAARAEAPDVVVLDLMLPGVDGLEVARELRGFSDAYIIMLTAKAEEVDRIVGLSVGADDYLSKPFSPRELVARIHAMLRRPRGGRDRGDVRRLGDLVIDVDARQVHVDGRPVELTRTEFDLLDTLSERPRVVQSRGQLLERLRGSPEYRDEHVVDVHVANLRRKLDDPDVVVTVRGVGYRMGVPP
ncbi:MAG TPA: response regulator transcription factor [Euzebyales bacterium]|nr:response regulator transcription factor [Euzebyales bacterium]